VLCQRDYWQHLLRSSNWKPCSQARKSRRPGSNDLRLFYMQLIFFKWRTKYGTCNPKIIILFSFWNFLLSRTVFDLDYLLMRCCYDVNLQYSLLEYYIGSTIYGSPSTVRTTYYLFF
jgi:hypothetical protein